MRQDFVRFKPELLQIGTPLRVNVYELDAKGNARIVWTLGHVFQPIDLTEVLNPARRLLVLKNEQQAALRDIELAADSTESDLEDDTPHWCG